MKNLQQEEGSSKCFNFWKTNRNSINKIFLDMIKVFDSFKGLRSVRRLKKV